MHKDWETTLVGRASLIDGSLKVESNSIARADELRRRLEVACPGLLRHRGREHSDPFAAVERSAASEPKGDLPAEVEQQLVREFKEHHYADWPDQPLPALGDQTARAAARTRRGRAQVDLLLRELGASRTPLAASRAL